MDLSKFQTDTKKNTKSKFISLTDEFQKLSFEMKKTEKVVDIWDGKKLVKASEENENDKNARVHWWFYTTEGKICSLTNYQFTIFLEAMPDTKNVPDVYTCELKLGFNERNKPCLKVRV
jgi:hypothetical protein